MLEEFLLSLGYSEEQIHKLRKMVPSHYSDSTLLYNVKNLYHYFRRNGIDNNDFIRITLVTPSILINSLEMIRIKVSDLNQLGFHKTDAFSMIKDYPYLLELSLPKIKNKMEKFFDLSFPRDNVISLLANYPVLFRMEPSSFKKKFDFFIEYGYREKEAIKILSSVPQLFDDSIQTIQKKISDFQKMGFTNFDIIKITTYLPELYLHSTSLIQEMFNDLTEFGYSELDEIQIIKKVPILLKDYYFNQINDRLDFLLSIGFSKQDIVFMTCNNPYIFLYSNDSLEERITTIASCGYLLEPILKMIRDFPYLFGYDPHLICDKLNYYQSLGIDSIILENSRYLYFPLDLVKARVSFLEKKGPITDKNCSTLFLEDYPFYKKYKITKEELLKGDYS